MCWSPNAPYLRRWLYLEIEPSKKKKIYLFILEKERAHACASMHDTGSWYQKIPEEDGRQQAKESLPNETSVANTLILDFWPPEL